MLSAKIHSTERPSMRRLATVILMIAVAVCLGACATKVKAEYMAPAQFAIGGITRLAVAEFRAYGGMSSSMAPELSDRIVRELSGEGFFTVVPGAPRVSAEGGGAGWRSWAQDNDVHGVLAGTIDEARVRHEVSHERIKEDVHTGRYRDEVYIEGGQVRKRRVEIVRQETRLIPTVRKYAELNATVALLDARTGVRVSSQTYRKTSSTYAQGEDRVRSMDADDYVLEKLASQIAREVVRDLVPRAVQEKITLADDKACAEGLKRARQGDWADARTAWERVVAADPANHVALYNIGVAAEIAQHYAEARDYYAKAAAIERKDLYTKALARVEQRLRQQRQLNEQLKGR